MTGTVGSAAEELGRLLAQGSAAGLAEGQLLERFVERGDETALGVLIERHGPMVLGVCRGLLSDPNDVDDAFQATFLVLVRRAEGLSRRDQLSSWIYGVALRVARRAREQTLRGRLRLRDEGKEPASHAADSSTEAEAADLRRALHDEIARLPEAFRSAVILHHLEGRSHEEAALLLDRPVGTIKSRLARARELLRRRLVRRGFTAGSLATASFWTTRLEAASGSLVASTISQGLVLTGRAATGTTVLGGAVALMEGVIRNMSMSPVKFVVPALMATGLFASFQSPSASPDVKSAVKSNGRSVDFLETVQGLVVSPDSPLILFSGADVADRNQPKVQSKSNDIEARTASNPGPDPDSDPFASKSADLPSRGIAFEFRDDRADPLLGRSRPSGRTAKDLVVEAETSFGSFCKDFEEGRNGVGPIVRSAVAALDAKLALDASPDARNAAFSELDQRLSRIEAIAKQKFELGRLARTTYDEVRLARLEAKIRMGREWGFPSARNTAMFREVVDADAEGPRRRAAPDANSEVGERDKALRDRLEAIVDLKMKGDVKFSEVLELLAKQSQGKDQEGISVYVTPQASVKVSRQPPNLFIEMKSVPLKTGLKFLLQSYGLKYEVVDGVLVISEQ